jgi:hypothetical protein
MLEATIACRRRHPLCASRDHPERRLEDTEALNLIAPGRPE